MTRGSADGFSIIEMLAALFVVAIAISIFSGGYGVRQSAPTANTMAKRIAIDAAALSARSVATGTTRPLIADVMSGTISIGSVHFDLPKDLKMTVKTGAELISQGAKGFILFYPDGTSSGGEISFSDTSGTGAVISINWVTGAVQITERLM